MEKVVVFAEEFHQDIENLITVLFEKEYFGFKSDCQSYAEKIYDFVEDNIDLPVSKITPLSFHKFGKRYLKYKANHRTTWYIFFTEKNGRFLVTHILNNHSKDFLDLL